MKDTTSSPKRVLIVDDEEHITIAIEFLMQQNGFETAVAHNGQAAMTTVASFRPDVIILDVMMPIQDGLETAAALRSNPDFQETKIIFLTAKGTREDRLVGYGSGGDVYLTKPFDNERLVELVKEVLEVV